MKRKSPDERAGKALLAERRNDTYVAGIILAIVVVLSLAFIWHAAEHYSDNSKTGGSVTAQPEGGSGNGMPAAAASGSSGSSSGSSGSSSGAASGSSSGSSGSSSGATASTGTSSSGLNGVNKSPGKN